jgi:hypothetical protein
VMSQCDGDPAQRWEASDDGSVHVVGTSSAQGSDGYKHGGMCMDFAADSWMKKLQVWACWEGSPNQVSAAPPPTGTAAWVSARAWRRIPHTHIHAVPHPQHRIAPPHRACCNLTPPALCFPKPLRCLTPPSFPPQVYNVTKVEGGPRIMNVAYGQCVTVVQARDGSSCPHNAQPQCNPPREPPLLPPLPFPPPALPTHTHAPAAQPYTSPPPPPPQGPGTIVGADPGTTVTAAQLHDCLAPGDPSQTFQLSNYDGGGFPANFPIRWDGDLCLQPRIEQVPHFGSVSFISPQGAPSRGRV